MGQSCMKSGQINQTLNKKTNKCIKCRNIINDFSTHHCLILTKLQQNRPLLSKNQSQLNIMPATLVQFYGGGVYQAQNQNFNIKIFKDNQKTQTKWIKQPTWFFPTAMRNIHPQLIKKRSFQEKLYWFRLNIERIRIPWENGAQKINVDRSNILMSSKSQLQKIDLRKQVKIVFTDETVDDAGGLLRQYMHLALKQIFSPDAGIIYIQKRYFISLSQGIFQMAQSKQLAYRFKWDDTLVDQYVIQCMKVLGLIIGKALFQRISINCYLDRTILRQIAGQPVHIEDIYAYDLSTYKSLTSILNSLGASQIALNFCIYHQNPGHQQIIPIQLIPDGQNIFVKDTNKQQYAKLFIHNYCTLSCKKYLQVLRQHIYKVVPYPLISIFEPIQLQMMLHGPENIDVKDWKTYTDYKGYKASDKQIKWFWEFVQKLSQQKLQNLLHYVTGTSRVPILGFKYLESNRNQLVRFTIQRSQYDKSNPYPKSYTCFNRIHLPAYQNKQQMYQKLDQVTKNELNHFGLD